jgi:hypothetical protein
MQKKHAMEGHWDVQVHLIALPIELQTAGQVAVCLVGQFGMGKSRRMARNIKVPQ